MLLAPGVHAENRRALSLTDLLTTVRVSDPTLRPDGHLVAFVRTTTDLTSGKPNADIYVVPADGSAPPRLLAGGTSMESTPWFLPDGKRVVFISDANKTPQLYIVTLDGGEPKPLTSLRLGVRDPLIPSADGHLVAFVSDVFRDCSDEACNARRADEVERDSVKMRRLTELMFRHWNESREQRRQHVFVAAIKGGRAEDITPGDYDAPPHNYEAGACRNARPSAARWARSAPGTASPSRRNRR